MSLTTKVNDRLFGYEADHHTFCMLIEYEVHANEESSVLLNTKLHAVSAAKMDSLKGWKAMSSLLWTDDINDAIHTERVFIMDVDIVPQHELKYQSHVEGF